MAIYISNDDELWLEKYQALIYEKFREDLFVKKYPIFKAVLELSKTLDFNLRVYNNDVVRKLYINPYINPLSHSHWTYMYLC